MGFIDNAIKSLRLLGGRRYTNDSLGTAQEAFTRTIDIGGLDVFTQDNLIPTQDLEPWYEENSNLYLFSRESFAKTNARIGSNPKMMQTPAFESSDIDTPDDWDMAVIAAQYFIKKGVVQNVQSTSNMPSDAGNV